MNFSKIEDVLFVLTVGAYLISMVLYFLVMTQSSNKSHKAASTLVKVGFLFHSLAILSRGIAAQRPPLSNQYEFATAFAWGIALFFLLFEAKYRHASLGAFVLPIVFLIIGYAAMQNREIKPLMPALQSIWLVIHVAMAIIGYGSFAVAAGVSAMYLAKGSNPNKKLPPLEDLDGISYRAVIFGYLFLTLTIITGALWAQKAWGRYWSWDPKETWSLITWFIYTAYLHMRKTKGMAGKKAALFAILGFLAVIFTYIGVNKLLPSLHSYV